MLYYNCSWRHTPFRNVAIPVRTVQREFKSVNKNLDPEQLERLKNLAQQYAAKGMSIVPAFNQASIDLTGKGVMGGGVSKTIYSGVQHEYKAESY